EILKSNAYDPYIIGNLSDLKSSNTSIIGSTIVNKNFTYYQDTMLTDKVLSSIFNPNYYEYFENNIKKTAWIFKNMSLGGGGQPYYTGILFNISPIKDGDTTLGYFVISCHIPKIIESFGFKDNEFLKKANLYLYNQYGDTYSLYSYNEDKNIPQKLTAEIPPDSKTIHKHNSLLIYNQIENTEIGLSVYLPFRYIIAENKFTNILIIITTLFIIFLCLMTEKRFTYGIISSLNGLFERMNMYIKSKQETEPEPNIKEKNHVKDTDS
ncbi:MAG: hypothetical protein RSC29_07515, partial [Oscillospiraceae bacterium]